LRQRAILSIAAAVVAVTMGAGAKERSSNLSSQVLQEIAKIEAEIDRTEAQAIERLAAPPDNQIQQIELLGKLMLYDKDLSVSRLT
jgi:cytochrome c peroxidase